MKSADNPGVFGSAPAAPGFPAFLDYPDSELCRTLASLAGRHITCLLNKGNRGDGLIHMGGRRLLRSLALKWCEIVHPEPACGDVLLVYGNGNLGRKHHHMVEMLGAYLDRFQEIVILPSTIDARVPCVRSLLRKLPPRTTVFCREQVSFHLLRAAGVVQPVRLAHDLAFFADVSEWRSRKPQEQVACLYRTDREKLGFTTRPKVGPVFDASSGNDDDPEGLLDCVARFATIHTDRTHAAISAALMGREVVFHPNAYYKNKAMFEHSLCHFPNVSFAPPILDWPVFLRETVTRAYRSVRSIDRRLRAATGIFPPRNRSSD